MAMIASLFLLLWSGMGMTQTQGDRHFWKADLKVGLTQINVKTKQSSTTQAASTSYSQIEIRPGLQYFFNRKTSVSAYYFHTAIMKEYNSVGYGIGGRYYFYGMGTKIESTINDQVISQSPRFNLYGEVGYKRQSIEAENIDLKFNGFEVAVGAEKFLKDDWYCSLSFHPSFLKNGPNRSAITMSFLVGLGKMF